MTVRPWRIAAALLLLSVVAGCTSGKVPWTNPSVSRDQAQDDYDDCRRYADDQIDPAHGADQSMRNDTVVSRGQRDDDKRRRAMYVRACMESKGYRPATR
jgi:hypothetical protein